MAATEQVPHAAIIDVAQRATVPCVIDPDKLYGLVLPDGYALSLADGEAYLPHPRRPRGRYQPETVEALYALVERHGTAATTVWVNSERVVAVFNDDANLAGWRDHRAALTLTTTPQWDHWLASDGVQVSQASFAELIEDGQREIVTPDAATMLEIAQNFHATTSAQFRAAHRLQSGQVSFVYDEAIDAKAGQSGELQVPREFTIAVSPYMDEPPVELTARLKYRLKSGTLTIGYKLDRPDTALRDAVRRIADRLSDAGHPVYEGSPAQ